MENFSQLLLYELTGDRGLINLGEHEKTWNFFQGESGNVMSANYPDDLDTTSLALTVLDIPNDIVHSVMDRMLEYRSRDGITLVYFDKNRSFFDPIVCINILTLFHIHGRGHQLPETLEWVHQVLLTKAYLDGTRYYVCGELFLFFLVRFLQRTVDQKIHALIIPTLTEHIRELIGSKGEALTYSIRILVCHYIGIQNHRDCTELLKLQCEDGSWEPGWAYQFGKTKIRIGNRGLTTALAMRAVQTLRAGTVYTRLGSTGSEGMDL